MYDVMTQIDPAGLESRGKVGQKKRRRGPTSIGLHYPANEYCTVHIASVRTNKKIERFNT